jgi:ABC-type phosphate transport system substrate-binding protein
MEGVAVNVLRPALFIFLATVLAAIGPPAGAQDTDDIRIVVHPQNPVDTITRAELSKYFLKELTEWPNGRTVEPIDLPPDSPVRIQFSDSVHGRTVKAIEAYWHRKLFQGEGVPPVSTTAEKDVIFFVMSSRNAVGYVSSEIAEGSGAKIVSITD